MQGTGKELKIVLDYLRDIYPEFSNLTEIKKILGEPLFEEDYETWKKPQKTKIFKLLVYATDKGWITGGVTTFRLTAQGLDKLGSWTDSDDKLVI